MESNSNIKAQLPELRRRLAGASGSALHYKANKHGDCIYSNSVEGLEDGSAMIVCDGLTQKGQLILRGSDALRIYRQKVPVVRLFLLLSIEWKQCYSGFLSRIRRNLLPSHKT